MSLGFFKRGLKSGTHASISSALALAIMGKIENQAYSAPLNAISHWIHGDKAFKHVHFDLSHTVTGYAIHHASSIFWAQIYAYLLARNHRSQPLSHHQYACLIAAIAAFVDFNLTPSRLTPGFEKRLSKKALCLVYASFALGLSWNKGSELTRADPPSNQRA